MLTDPVADMLTRIRNANKALHDSAEMPTSKLKVEIARILKEEGYIRDFHVSEDGPHPTLVVEMKYGRGRERVLSGLRRVSKPGRRIYAGKTRRQRVKCRANLVKLADRDGIDRRDDQPAATNLFDQSLLLEQLQRVADGLP